MLGRRQGKLADIAGIYQYSRLTFSDLGGRNFGGEYWSMWKVSMFGEKPMVGEKDFYANLGRPPSATNPIRTTPYA